MSDARIVVAFYSTYGTNAEMAKIAAEAAAEAGAEVRLRRIPETAPQEVIDTQDAWKAQQAAQAEIPEITHDDMEWGNGYLFSSPTRFGDVASQVRVFIDTLGPLWQSGALANKAVSAMTSAQNVHGGQEATLLNLYTTVMHWGSIIAVPGYTDPCLFESGGNPYGFSTVGGQLDDAGRASIRYQATRLAEVAAKLAA